MFGRKLAKWFVLTINIIVAFLMLITLLGSVYSPEKFLFPAYFSLIYPIIIIVNIGFVLFWVLVRKWNFLLSLSLLLISAQQISNVFPIHIGKAEVVNKSFPIHILSYNTKMSGNLVKDKPLKPNNVMRYIANSNADIVCLQEFDVSTLKEYLTFGDMLRIFNQYRFKHIEFKVRSHTNIFGIATFSKFPIVKRQRIDYLTRGNISISTDIDINGKIVRIFNNHLESNRITDNDKAMPTYLKENFNADNLTGLTVHFGQKLGVAYKLRAHQADTVSKLITESPFDVLVCGDFNDVPGSYAYNTMRGKLKDAFSETGTGFGWTFAEPLYGFRIDYIFYNPKAFTPINFVIDKVKYSDHYPVHCQMNINKL